MSRIDIWRRGRGHKVKEREEKGSAWGAPLDSPFVAVMQGVIPEDWPQSHTAARAAREPSASI